MTGIPLSKRETLVFSHRLEGLRRGEQLVAKARLTIDAKRLGCPARISCRLFAADEESQLEPGGGRAARAISWKGHLSKPTGFNCLPDEGARTALKFGVLRVLENPGRPLYLNLVAVSAAPAAPVAGRSCRSSARTATWRSSATRPRWRANPGSAWSTGAIAPVTWSGALAGSD